MIKDKLLIGINVSGGKSFRLDFIFTYAITDFLDLGGSLMTVGSMIN